MGIGFGCVSVARELTLVCFQMAGNKAILLGLGRLDSGHIVHFIFFVQQRVVPRNYYFLLIF